MNRRKFRTRPEIGSVLECAIWLDGRETPTDRRQFEADVRTSMQAQAARDGIRIGPMTWTEKKPGEARVPPPPDHITGPNVRLLVGEAIVTGHEIVVWQKVGFVDDLEPRDLEILRRITRKKYAEEYPLHALSNGPLTDRQCDTLINDLGPDVAVSTLESARAEILH